MIDKEKFGQALLTLRKEKNMSQKELASRLNVTPAAVSKWEHGQNYPDITMISTIAEIFEISCDALLQPDRILKPELYATSTNIATDSTDTSTKPVNVYTNQTNRCPKSPLRVFLITALLVCTCTLLVLFFIKMITPTFEIVSTRSTKTVMDELILEVAVLFENAPDTEDFSAYCTTLMECYKNGEFGSGTFQTMKVLFYTAPEPAGSFEEELAEIVSYLYFEG